MPEARERSGRSPQKRSRWVLLAAYGSLALLIAYGVVRARADKSKAASRAALTLSYPVYDAPPAPEPLSPSPLASRVVRWCQVLEVLEAKCQRCHGSPPTNGAPLSFMAYRDTQREHPAGSGQSVFVRMHDMVRHRRMPPVGQPVDPPVQPLDAREKDLLLVWLEEGALAFGGEACKSAPKPGAAGSVSR
jgi:hypothetical protein